MVGGIVCVFISHTHRTDSIWLHTMASQNDRTHSTIYSLSLGTITRYTLWDALQDSSTSHRLFCFLLLFPLSSHSRHIFNYVGLYYILICGFKGQTDTYYKKEIYVLTHLARGILGFALFIHLSDSALAVSALQWPNRTSLRTLNRGLTSSCLILNDSLGEILIMRMYSKRQQQRLIKRP